jgi:hypothetical protein
LSEGEGADERRHRCLVRWVIRRRLEDRDAAHQWLERWGRLHPRSRLARDVREQWERGNRGADGEWRDSNG